MTNCRASDEKGVLGVEFKGIRVALATNQNLGEQEPETKHAGSFQQTRAPFTIAKGACRTMCRTSDGKGVLGVEFKGILDGSRYHPEP